MGTKNKGTMLIIAIIIILIAGFFLYPGNIDNKTQGEQEGITDNSESDNLENKEKSVEKKITKKKVIAPVIKQTEEEKIEISTTNEVKSESAYSKTTTINIAIDKETNDVLIPGINTVEVVVNSEILIPGINSPSINTKKDLSELIKGKWLLKNNNEISVDFDDSNARYYNQNKLVSKGKYKIVESTVVPGEYIITEQQSNKIIFKITNITETKLTLIYLPVGKVIEYIK